MQWASESTLGEISITVFFLWPVRRSLLPLNNWQHNFCALWGYLQIGSAIKILSLTMAIVLRTIEKCLIHRSFKIVLPQNIQRRQLNLVSDPICNRSVSQAANRYVCARVCVLKQATSLNLDGDWPHLQFCTERTMPDGIRAMTFKTLACEKYTRSPKRRIGIE